jgi:glycine/D-amino acid oxidase-like deaminating enzyme
MDRIHAYLPGWDVPKISKDLLTDHFGLVSDFLSECMSRLRRESRVAVMHNRVLFGGADQPEPSRRTQDSVLVQRTGQLMYELSTLYPVVSGIRPEYAWATPMCVTSDGMPIVGSHRHFPRHLFALGFGHGGITASFLASRLLLRQHLGRSGKGDELFGFAR